MPGLQARSPVGVLERQQHINISLPLFKKTKENDQSVSQFSRALDGPTPLVRLTGFFGPLSPLCPPRIQYQRGEGGVLIALAKQCCDPLRSEATVSWWNTQAYAPQFIKLNV